MAADGNIGQIGEFSFVLAAIGAGGGLLSPNDYRLAIAVIALSLLAIPAVADVGETIPPRRRRRRPQHAGCIAGGVRNGDFHCREDWSVLAARCSGRSGARFPKGLSLTGRYRDGGPSADS